MNAAERNLLADLRARIFPVNGRAAWKAVRSTSFSNQTVERFVHNTARAAYGHEPARAVDTSAHRRPFRAVKNARVSLAKCGRIVPKTPFKTPKKAA